MPSAYEGTDIIMSAANNKVPGYPLEIFDFVSGSGSYIMLAEGKYIIRQRRISYRASDISLKSAASYGIILTKVGAFMSVLFAKASDRIIKNRKTDRICFFSFS